MQYNIQQCIKCRFVLCFRYGIENEGVAKTHYIDKISAHESLTVEDCGLFINPVIPWIAASPDAILSCKCHGKGVLEIKCPHSLVNMTFAELCQSSTYCLKEVIER